MKDYKTQRCLDETNLTPKCMPKHKKPCFIMNNYLIWCDGAQIIKMVIIIKEMKVMEKIGKDR